jgi:Uma2 family endonuclease
MAALPAEWLYPPPGGWTLADISRLPEGCRVEVLDGALIVNTGPPPIHQRIARRLAAALEPQLGDDWQLELDVDLLLAEEPLDYLAPDIVVFERSVPLTTRPIRRESVLLVVEVVSKGSRKEDRGSKPLAYAEAGIPHFWRVESPASGVLATAVHTFDLDPEAGVYRGAGIHHGKLYTDIGLPVAIDLAVLDS